jgi:hypothetical protein
MDFKTEDQLQAYCFRYWSESYRHISYLFAVPNGGTRVIAEAVKLKATGTRKGVSDLVLITKGSVYFIELKNGKAGRLSPHQELFSDKVTALDHSYTVCYTFAEFKELLDKIFSA